MSKSSKATQAVEKAAQMLAENYPLMEIQEMIWDGCDFAGSAPIYIPQALDIAFALYDKYKDGARQDIAHCMLLLGRTFNVKGEYLPACRFYLCAQKRFRGGFYITAMEFFREELREAQGKKQISLSREEFREKYKKDTPQALVEEYRSQESP